MLTSGWGLVVRRALHDRLVVAAAFATVVLATALLAAVPIYGDAVALSGLRSTLAQAPPSQAGVEVDGAPAADEDYVALDRSVSRTARSIFAATGVAVWRSGDSGPFSARGHGDATYAFGFREGLAGHARVVAGGLGTAAGGGSLGVAVEEGSGLRLGDTLSLRSLLGGRDAQAKVTAVFRRVDADSVYWGGSDRQESSVALVLPRHVFEAQEFAGSSFRWRLAPRFDRLAASELPGLRNGVSDLERRLNAGRPAGRQLAVYTDLDSVLADAAQSLDSARASVLVPSSQLAVLAAYALLFTAGLLLERRALSVEILRLRGATPGEIVTMSAMEAALIALPAAAIAPWLAAGLLRALNVVGPLASVNLTLRPEVGSAAYALAFAAAAVAIMALTVPALRARRVAIAAGRRRLPLAGLAQRSYLDLALAALALIGYWQLRRYRTPLLEESGGGARRDPFLIAAPALLLLAGGLIAQRLVPLAARLADRTLSASRGVVGALGPAQLARRPRRYTRAGLLLVLAIAIGIFAAAYTTTWDTSQGDQAAYQAGADVLVRPSGADTAPPPIALAAGYRSLGGVSALSPAVRQDVDYGGAGGSGSFLALDAKRLPVLANVRSDFASQPLGELSRRLARGSSAVPSLQLPGKPTRLRVETSLSAPEVKRARAPWGVLLPPQALTATLLLSLRDDAGLVYQFRLGDPAQGPLEVDLVPHGSRFRPDYPLSLVSLDLNIGQPF
ncbi:MAG TPA: FtsX-like permease family protein, partial [Gaiellaceae bacterium]|nr:FtsX-like permease family protein [Gaiellaceae bacterium]